MRNETGCFSDVSLGLCPDGPRHWAFLAMELMEGVPKEDAPCVFTKAGGISSTCQGGPPA